MENIVNVYCIMYIVALVASIVVTVAFYAIKPFRKWAIGKMVDLSTDIVTESMQLGDKLSSLYEENEDKEEEN